MSTATPITEILPKPVDCLATSFGDISNLPPKDQIPEEFWSHSNPWNDLANKWFFGLLKAVPPIKPHIDRTAALMAIRACLCSFEPSHQHKSAGVGYLLSLWCEPSAIDLDAKPAGDKPKPRNEGRKVGKGRMKKRNRR